MPLSVGSRLGHYDVTALIGEGGMGQVYQATDTKLNRQVALKILPEAFATDPDRLARFQREAQVLASLNHPGIAAIYGIEESDDTRALVLELVEGPTLADRIGKGPIPVDEALPIAKQIAEALEAAHEAGVIHRDLKPANIKVKDDGTVKVLDFGLAKALDPSSDSDPSQSPTLTAAATQMGVIMGTAAYMSPEQARGKTVDKRADIWAFGCVLYEMLTGQRAFQGEDVSLTLASVMKSDLNVKTLPPALPATVRTVLRRCLEKDVSQRIRDIGDVRLAMEGAFEVPAPRAGQALPAEAAPWSFGWRRALSTLAALAVGATIAGVVSWNLKPQTPGTLTRFVITPPPEAPLADQGGFDLIVSPDGQRIAYLADTERGSMLYVREIDDVGSRPIPGSEGASDPFFSWDSDWIGFESPQQGTLMKAAVEGGPPLTIAADSTTRGAVWGPDDTVIVARRDGLWRVSAGGGGTPELLTPSDSGDEYFEPRMLPSGDAIVFGLQEGAGLENEHVATLSLETGEQRVLIEGASNPYYAASGHLLFVRGSTLMAAPFDVENVEVIGEPVVLPESVRRTGQLAADYALSDTGTLVYVPGGDGFSIGRTLVWVDRSGQEEPTAVPEAEYVWARVSPDGDRVASHSVERDNTDVWISELARGTRIRLTTDLAADSRPLWTQDGERIVFASDRGGSWGLYARAADGTGVVEHLVTVEDVISLRPYGWSPDGNVLLFDYRTDSRDIGLLRMNNGGAWEPLLQTDANEGQPALSPDGEWLAYASNETGQFEIYVQQFPDLGGRRQISTGGGIDPLWSSDGTELFYYSVPPTAMMVVAIGREPTFAVGNPEVVFEQRYYRRQRDGRQHSIAPDSTRFLMVKGVGATNDTDAPGQIVVVQNWHQELLERVPVD